MASPDWSLSPFDESPTYDDRVSAQETGIRWFATAEFVALLLCPPTIREGNPEVATKTNVVLIDDLDGSEAEETIKFGLDGVTYEIDLSAKNAARLRKELSPYVESARRIGGRAVRGRAPKQTARGAARKADTAEIRAWAREQGYDVSDRGRIPAEIVEAYQKARR